MTSAHNNVMFSGNIARRGYKQERSEAQPFFQGDRVRLTQSVGDKGAFWRQYGHEFTLNRMWKLNGKLFASDENSEVFPCADLELV